jgi:TPR repeat protein
MGHDIFVSHSAKDKIAADAAVAHLERGGLRCWCAPRDIRPGTDWPSSIVEGINGSKAMVVVLSSSANESGHIPREVERAVNRGIPVIPVRIEDVVPRGGLEYFFSSSHWMDAITPPLEQHFDRLAQQLRTMLQMKAAEGTPTAPIHDTKRKSSRRLAPVAGAAAVVLAIAIGVVLSYFTRKPAKPVSPVPVTITAAATTAPAVSPEETSAAVAKSAAPIAPSPSQSLGISPLADEYNEWKKLAMITWDNSYLIDHARQRYPEWRRAADQGDAIGEFFVGYCYQHGLTVPEDLSTGFEWFTKSAAQKNSDAMFAVALCCALGLGTQQNTLGYARWINEAVAAGNTSAEVAMGVGMMTFPVGPTDKEQGKQHIAKAAAAGNFDGVFWDALVNSNSPAEMTAQLQKAAAAGQPDALIALVENGSGGPQGRTSVLKALTMMGNPFMIARIIDPTLPGGFYHKNLFPDLTAARLRKMADNGSAEAARLVGELKAKGKAH